VKRVDETAPGVYRREARLRGLGIAASFDGSGWVSVRERRAFAGRAPSAVVVAVILAAFALTGLGAGVLTRSALGAFASPTATATTQPTATATLAPSPSPNPTATYTPATGGSRFAIVVVASPNPVAAGSSFTVTVTATNDGSKTPAGGVLCTLRAPQGDANPLFAVWPAQQTTDSAGSAQWQLTAPSAQAGRYTLEVYAQRGGASYTFDTSVALRA
jgi:hypothetical protein